MAICGHNLEAISDEQIKEDFVCVIHSLNIAFVLEVIDLGESL